MSMSMRGMGSLNKKLQRLADGVPRMGQQAARASGQVILDEARVLVAVDEGDLRDSLAMDDHEVDGNPGVIIGTTMDPNEVGEHADDIEYGDENNAAQPFMRPAVDTKTREAARAFEDSMREQIEDAVG